MWACTSEAHDLCMTNLYQAQQLANDVKRARESAAQNRRLRKAGRASVHGATASVHGATASVPGATEAADPAISVPAARRRHPVFAFRRHSLAPR